MLDWAKKHPWTIATVSVVVVVILVSFVIPLHGQMYEKGQYPGDEHYAPYETVGAFVLVWLTNSLDSHAAAITGFATVLLTVVTWLLVNVARTQNSITREMIEGRRAFVFAANIDPQWTFDKDTGHYHWKIRPVWQNSGETATKNLRLYADSFLSEEMLPRGFDFTQIAYAPGTGLLGPKVAMAGGAVPRAPKNIITPFDIVALKENRKFLYIWGWVKYYDVFPKTHEHLTRFCFQIFPVGEPFKFNPDSALPLIDKLVFGYVHHVVGNCADDECKTQGHG